MAKIAVGDKEYDFDPREVTNDEGMAIERVTGLTFDQWNKSLTEGSMSSMTALVWMLQKRENPELRISDVHFKMGDVRGIPDEEQLDQDEELAKAFAEEVPGGLSASMDPKVPGSVEDPYTTEG